MPNRRGAIPWVSSHSYRCLSSGTAGNRTPRRVDGMNWQRPSPVPFVPVPRTVSRRGAASNITIYNLVAAGGIEPPTSEEVALNHTPGALPHLSEPAMLRTFRGRVCRLIRGQERHVSHDGTTKPYFFASAAFGFSVFSTGGGGKWGK